MVATCRTDDLFRPNAGSFSISRGTNKEAELVDLDDDAVSDGDGVLGESGSFITGTARTPVKGSSVQQSSTKSSSMVKSVSKKRSA